MFTFLFPAKPHSVAMHIHAQKAQVIFLFILLCFKFMPAIAALCALENSHFTA